MFRLNKYIFKLFLEKNFREYVIENQEQRNKEIVTLIKQQYLKDMKRDDGQVANLGINALEKGLIIKVLDKSDKVIWDADSMWATYCRMNSGSLPVMDISLPDTVLELNRYTLHLTLNS